MMCRSHAGALFCILILLFPLVGCAVTSSELNCRSADIFCVGVVTSVGGLQGDLLNRLVWDSIEGRASSAGYRAYLIETVEFQDYRKNIASFTDKYFDLVITVGRPLLKATFDAATDFPGILFIGLDQEQEIDPLPANLAIVLFPEDQGGFMAGALAGLTTQTGNVSAVLPHEEIPSIQRYGQGFQAGVAHAAPDVIISLNYNSQTSFENSFTDTVWAEDTVESLVEQNVDVIFTYEGEMAEAAMRKATGDGIYAIGSEQDFSTKLLDQREFLLGSVIPVVKDVLDMLMDAALEDAFEGGIYQGTYEYLFPTPRPEALSDEILEQLEIVRAGLSDGSLETGLEVLPEAPPEE